MRGRDIKAYEANWAGLWIILAKYQSHLILEQKYPIIYQHLEKYKEKLQKRGQCRYGGKGNQGQHHWLELDNNPSDNYMNEFSKQKIVYKDISKKLSFALSESGQYFNNTVYFIANNPSLYFQLAILNSDLINWYYKQISVQLGAEVVRMFSIYMKQIPIPKISKIEQQPFIDLVEQVLNAKQIGKDTAALEIEIDKIVYKLYQLTAAEINLIEQRPNSQ